MAGHLATLTATPGTVQTVITELYGYSIREDSGAAAVIEFRHGTVTGQIIAFLGLVANESFQFSFEDNAIDLPDGLYIKEVSGSVEAILWHKEGA